MIRRLADTNGMIALIGGRSEALMQRVDASTPRSLAMSSIVAHELCLGAYKSARIEHNLGTLRLTFIDIAILAFDREGACTASENPQG